MISVEHDIEIIHPKIETFDFISQIELHPEWHSGMLESILLTEGPFGVGSKYKQKMTLMGQEMKSIFEVVEFEPGHRLKVASLESPIPLQITRFVLGNDELSHVHAVLEAQPSGMFKLMAGMIKKMVAETTEKDHHTLKSLLEGK